MQQKQRRDQNNQSQKKSGSARSAPKRLNQLGQDPAVRKQAADFPGVGITLGSYKHNPFNDNSQNLASKRGTNNSNKQKSNKPNLFRRIFTVKRVILVLVLIILGTGGWLGSKFLYNAHKVFGGNILSVLTTTKLKGEDTGRVNILLAGNSADDPGHDGANLTDSILLMSIDTKNNQAFLLSIPRDLYVQIGDDGHSKINAAYPTGQSEKFSQDGYPAGGMGLLEQTVSTDFGIPINYYALVDYSALKEAVDAVGGITVTIASTDPRGLYDPSIDYATNGPLVKLTNGMHTLNGEQALDLARARGDSYYSYGFAASDFQRTADQRQELVALKTKAVSAGVLSNPAKLSSLADAIGSNVHTDLKLSEVHRLYDLTKNISNVQSVGLNSVNGKNLLMSYTTFDGQSALIPAAGIDNYDAIQTYMNQITSDDPLVQEGASLVVLNGTTTAGLASKQEKTLMGKNFTVSAVGDAQASQATTTIIDTTGGKKPATAAALEKIYGNHLTTTNPYAGVYTADFIIVIGADQIPTVTPMPTASTSSSGQ